MPPAPEYGIAGISFKDSLSEDNTSWRGWPGLHGIGHLALRYGVPGVQSLQLPVTGGALFYCDYREKQARGKVTDPIFGPLDKLVNVPTSEITGVETEIVAQLAEGLTLNADSIALPADRIANGTAKSKTTHY